MAEFYFKRCTVNNRTYDIIHLTTVEADLYVDIANTKDQINLYGGDKSLINLAQLFEVVAQRKCVVFLEREDDEEGDFVIFHGPSTPINFRIYHQIRNQLQSLREQESFEFVSKLDAEFDLETWQLKELYSVKVSGECVLLSSNEHGLLYMGACCMELSETDVGHLHFDWYSTKKSSEIIIRNRLRDH